MKSIKGFAIAAILATLFAVAVPAQKEPSKDEWFQQIAKLTNTKKEADLVKAYEQSKEFLAKYGKDTDDRVKKIRDFAVRYRVGAFENAIGAIRMDDAIELGEDILTDEPENSSVTMILAYGGFQAFAQKQDKGYSSKSINYAKRTLELFKNGKLPKSFNPFGTQSEATAWMHYIIGAFIVEFDLKEAAVNFAKATNEQSQIKDDSYPYLVLANFYEKQYETQAADFKLKHGAKRTEDAAMKADMDAINATLDGMIDAYARAVKVSEAKPNPSSGTWKDRLNQIYQFRKGDLKGLPELLGSVLSTPVKEPK